MVIQTVKDSIKTGFEPPYVLADSWFMCDTFVSEILLTTIKCIILYSCYFRNQIPSILLLFKIDSLKN